MKGPPLNLQKFVKVLDNFFDEPLFWKRTKLQQHLDFQQKKYCSEHDLIFTRVLNIVQ